MHTVKCPECGRMVHFKGQRIERLASHNWPGELGQTKFKRCNGSGLTVEYALKQTNAG